MPGGVEAAKRDKMCMHSLDSTRHAELGCCRKRSDSPGPAETEVMREKRNISGYLQGFRNKKNAVCSIHM